MVVGSGGGGRVACSVRGGERGELRHWVAGLAGGVSTGLQYFRSTVSASAALPESLSSVTSLGHVGLTLSPDSQVCIESCRRSIDLERYSSISRSK